MPCFSCCSVVHLILNYQILSFHIGKEEERKKKAEAFKIATELARKKQDMIKKIEQRRQYRKHQARLRAKALHEATRLSEQDVEDELERERERKYKELAEAESHIGIWHREGKRMWRFQQTGQQESTRTNILDEAGSILADSKGTEAIERFIEGESAGVAVLLPKDFEFEVKKMAGRLLAGDEASAWLS